MIEQARRSLISCASCAAVTAALRAAGVTTCGMVRPIPPDKTASLASFLFDLKTPAPSRSDAGPAEPNRPLVIDLSGGSPDLVPEWMPWMMRGLMRAGLDHSTYLWTDDNLSTTYLFDRLSTDDLALLQSYRNYGRVCCFKGYDTRSFAFNTRAVESGFAQEFEVMRKLLELDLDSYGYVTLTSPYDDGIEAGVSDLLACMQELDVNLPLRVTPLEIRISPCV